MLGREMTLRGMFYAWGEGPKDHLWLVAGHQVPLLLWLTVGQPLHSLLLTWRPSLGGSYRETSQGSVQNITSLEHSGATWSPKYPPYPPPRPPSRSFHSQCHNLQILYFAVFIYLFPSLSVYNSDKGNEFLSIMMLMNLKGKEKRDVTSGK